MIPKYISLKEKINEEILNGKFPLGSKLPTEVQLAADYHVSRSTVRQALDLLVEEGIIAKRWGSGNTIISKSDTSKKNIVKLLVPDLNHHFYGNLYQDLYSTLIKEGFQLECHETSGQLSLEREALLSMMQDVYGGLIISPAASSRPSTNVDLLQLLLKRQTPIVFLEAVPNGIYNSTAIRMDEYAKGYQIARGFINQGCKIMGGIFSHDSSASVYTYSGFVDAIRDANLQIHDEYFHWVDSSNPHGIKSFIKRVSEKGCVIYVDDATLLPDDMEGNCHTNPLAPSKPMGKVAAKAFLEIKKNGNSSSITIPYK